MKEQHMCVDVNSYIADLNCPVTVKEGNPVAALSFKNLHAGTMIAIKFAAKGYNSFGEIVPVNGKNSLSLPCRIFLCRRAGWFGIYRYRCRRGIFGKWN